MKENMRKWDVIVVGAGPAGLSCAWTLVSRGLRVLILERKREIGVPVNCGELTRLEAINEFGYKGDEVWVYHEGLLSPILRGLAQQLFHKQFVAIKKDQFLKSLALKIIEKGGSIVPSTWVRRVKVEEKRVRLEAYTAKTREEYESECVIIAEGIDSALTRSVGLSSYLSPHRVLSMIVVTLREPKSLGVGAYPILKETPFILVFIKLSREEVNVCAGTLGTMGKKVFDLAVEHIKGWCCQYRFIRTGCGITPISPPVERPYIHRVIVAGSAGRFTDPLTGEGIYHAIKTGSIAGNAVCIAFEKGDFSENTLSIYREMLAPFYDHLIPYSEFVINLYDELKMDRAGFKERFQKIGIPSLYEKVVSYLSKIPPLP